MLISGTIVDFSWLEHKVLTDSEIWSRPIFGNPLSRYVIAITVLIVLSVATKFIKSVILKKLRSMAERTDSRMDDMIVEFLEKTMFPIFYFVIFYLSVTQLNLTEGFKRMIDAAGVTFLAIQATRFGLSVSLYFVDEKWSKSSNLNPTTFHGVRTVIKILFWVMCITFMLDNLGFNISTVVTGLGIGGVAIALAAQNILNDFFNYFVILFDRPFEKGDFIITGDYLGCIDHIGLKTTRISSLSGEQIVLSNSDLTSSRIRNYKKMLKRRVCSGFGVTYQTPQPMLKSIPEIVKTIISGIEGASFDRAHFKEYGDFSLNFEVVYYVEGNDYNRYMDIQQEINFRLRDDFDEKGIEFAYPTQTVYLAGSAKNEF
ncbi:MAG: mechanosensitive ion channel family protein [Candidatus Wallbacteria bacterium]|nr:mechanosensitive ion channel family protein [Candidatus Wallbacteria bacterium]